MDFVYLLGPGRAKVRVMILGIPALEPPFQQKIQVAQPYIQRPALALALVSEEQDPWSWLRNSKLRTAF